jgi:hypothetical protein
MWDDVHFIFALLLGIAYTVAFADTLDDHVV